jgi:hypothetical protein
VVDDPALVHSHDLLEAEGVRQEVDRGGAVLVEQIGSYPTHKAAI